MGGFFDGGSFDIPDVPEPTGGIPLPSPAPGGGGFGDLAGGVGGPAFDPGPGGSFDGSTPGTGGQEVPGQTDTGGGLGFKDLAGGVQAGAKALLPAVQIGTAGVGLAGGIRAAQTSAQQAHIARQAQRMQGDVLRSQQAAAAPLTQFGQNELQQAGAGQIPPAIQAKIDSWAQGAKAKAQDFAARSGQGNSTMLTQWLSWIDQQAQAMAADYLQEQQKLGVGALSAGANALSGAGQNAASLQQGAAAEQGGMARLMDEANRALASLSAGAS